MSMLNDHRQHDVDANVMELTRDRHRLFHISVALLLLIGSLARCDIFLWSNPWSPHHPDEDILPLEALALWEGVTPREVGWPASTTRLILGGIQAVQWTAARSWSAWERRASLDKTLETVTTWIGERYRHPKPLYQLGRTVSVVTGILQMCAMAWAAGEWLGPIGVVVSTGLVAVAPVVVAYSQYVLADITGLLFATILVGLAPNLTGRRAVSMGTLAGLASSSKFHFGLWILTPLIAIWLQRDWETRRKWWLSLATIGAAVWVTLTLVPWFLINPLLALKEFAGVVLVKIGHGPRLARIPANLQVMFGSLGALSWFGLIVASGLLLWRRPRRLAPIWFPVLLGTLVVSGSGTVFDRYVLVIAPGVILLAAWGWERWLLSPSRWLRLSAFAAIGICTIATVMGLAAAERRSGETDVDVLAQQWILGNVERGRRIALHDEDNAPLPRTAEQLRQCIAYVDEPAAWREKWLVEGVEAGDSLATPMQAVLLTDERFKAYWCRREFEGQTDRGYWITPYHNEKRFGAVLEREAIAEFRSGSRTITGGIDVLVTNRPVDVGRSPTIELRTERGQRIIYTR